MVWVTLSKERFPMGEYHKLNDRKFGLCQILEKLGSNAYRIELPDDLCISNVFNVQHLTHFYGDNLSLRISSSQEGEFDVELVSDQDGLGD